MLTNHNAKYIYEKKVENGSREKERERERERENITRKKLDWYLFNFLVTRHFQLCVKNYCFPCLTILFCFSVILNPFFSGFHSLRIKLKF